MKWKLLLLHTYLTFLMEASLFSMEHQGPFFGNVFSFVVCFVCIPINIRTLYRTCRR